MSFSVAVDPTLSVATLVNPSESRSNTLSALSVSIAIRSSFRPQCVTIPEPRVAHEKLIRL